jgi:hypothetical protein
VCDRQPVAHQRAQNRQDVVAAVVEPARADGRGQLSFVAVADAGQRVGDVNGGLVEQLSTVRSTLAATRAWKLTCPSVAARTSLSRKSATAATSSAAVGRPYNQFIRDRLPPAGRVRPIPFR